MRLTLLLILCHFPAVFYCQSVIEGRWKMGCGASTNNLLKESSSLNVRYISPRFTWSNDEKDTSLKEKEGYPVYEYRVIVSTHSWSYSPIC